MHGKIKGFDGLRAISVMLVIVTHGPFWSMLGISDPRAIAALHGTNGVKVFFALSGFLITLLLLKEHDATGTIGIRNFYVRRALRIFPLYFLAVALLLMLTATNVASNPKCAFPYALTYTQNFAPPSCDSVSMSHFWSLAVEEHFYLVWPFLFLLGRRLAFWFAVAFAAAALALGPHLPAVMPSADITQWTFPAAAPIAFGCIAAYIANDPRVRAAFTSRRWSPVILLAAATGLATPAFARSETAWLFGVTALLLYVFHNQGSWLVRALEVRLLVAIGVISYGLYVWHGVLMGTGPYRPPGAAFPPDTATAFWLTLLIAPISYVAFERPLLKLKGRFAAQRRSTASTDVPGERDAAAPGRGVPDRGYLLDAR